jgi:streptogramin lyase
MSKHHRGGRALLAAVLTLAAIGIGAAVPSPAGATTGAITLFGGTTANLFPSGGMAYLPGGNLFFTNPRGSAPHSIGQVTPAGVVTLITDAGITASPYDLTVGGDGNIWFTITTTNLIGRYDPEAAPGSRFTYYPSGNTFPGSITTAADGSIWYASGGNTARRMHTGGTGTAGSLGAATISLGTVGDIIRGPDGNIWITKSNSGAPSNAHELLEVHPTTGAITPHPLTAGNIEPRQLAIGPDDRLWFTYGGISSPGIGRYDTGTDTLVTYNIPANTNPKGITAGADGRLWFIQGNSSKVGRISATGTGYTTFTTTGFAFGPSPQEITVGPSNRLWFTAAGSPRRIGRIAIDPPSCGGRAITVDLNQSQTATGGNDVILGTDGADTVNGLGGNDLICGGTGADTIRGGVGNDKLFGEAGNDSLDGGAGKDALNGGAHRDTCNGRAGTDTQSGCETRRQIP